LNCHAGSGGERILSTDATNWSPGGDFFWLTIGYMNGGEASDPDNMGHNVVATGFSLTADATNLQAPGGTFVSSQLGCESCHDPHGQVQGGTPNGQLPISVSGSYGAVPPPGTIAGNYRLLGSTGYESIVAPAPIAVTAGFGESDTSHVAYGQGMAEWCASCHTAYTSGAIDKHPSGNLETLGGTIAGNYNAYVATGDFLGGAGATAYLQFVPFERQETVKTILAAAVTSTQGPAASDNVMCLTCHRAHASAFNNIGRWNFDDELLENGFPSDQNLTAMGAVANADYYGRDIGVDFGDYQRSFCNKCHVKD
jgi:cytochrome c553